MVRPGMAVTRAYFSIGSGPFLESNSFDSFIFLHFATVSCVPHAFTRPPCSLQKMLASDSLLTWRFFVGQGGCESPRGVQQFSGRFSLR